MSRNLLPKLAARLYPRSWRDRYGVEFDALLEETNGGWRDAANIAGRAIVMQFLARRAVPVAALAGLSIGLAWWCLLPKQFEVKVTVPSATDALTINRAAARVLSRSALSSLINRRNLYASLRTTEPLEDVIEQMRRDVMIKKAPQGMSLAFVYPDRLQAQEVTQELAAAMDVGVATQPTIGSRQPAWWPSAGVGTLLGVCAGLLWFAAGRRFLGWSVAGGLAFSLAAYLIPSTYRSYAVIQPQSSNLSVSFNMDQLADSVSAGFHLPAKLVRQNLHIEQSGRILLISFDGPDQRLTQKVNQHVVTTLMQRYVPGEIIDLATFPQTPISPNRPLLGALGVAAGGIFAWLRRPKRPVSALVAPPPCGESAA